MGKETNVRQMRECPRLSVATQTAAPLLNFFPRKTPISTAHLVLGIPASRPSRASPKLREPLTTSSPLLSQPPICSVLFCSPFPSDRARLGQSEAQRLR
ncbi:hypothetical protein BDP81DRAFT_421073 [Colletotrichum phormii]|uniref:Uncharacterized protein n=1 Tax=Colletotrichum phormii TaxID=359342 RepID=A0AAI9ZZN5_9PEZI|nr:uncharacterized protein BDP81DRAFT_421073 [Colletotrichum phormii]KAK1639482.1 hypothetical protein BDP81DRAFT_421073 [Colletotrichum phormii]